MKKYISYLTIVILFVVIPLMAIEYFARQLPNGYMYKHKWMIENSNDLEVLILGSSHTYNGINPEYIDAKAFNLAQGSQPLLYDYLLLMNYKYSKLNTLVLPISHFSLFTETLDKGKSWHMIKDYNLYMDIHYYTGVRYNFEISLAKTACLKAKSYLTGGSSQNKFSELGFGGHNVPKGTTTVPTSNDAAKRHNGVNLEKLDENYIILENIAQFAKEHNINLVLITTPTWHVYYDRLNKKQQSITQEAIAKIQSKYDVLYLDYLKDDRFIAEDFVNTDHLSTNGAEKFTKILFQDIKLAKKKN